MSTSEQNRRDYFNDMYKLIETLKRWNEDHPESTITVDPTIFYDDIGSDCHMCGKPVCHDGKTLCSSCQQVWDS